jgi:hypothetical protein
VPWPSGQPFRRGQSPRGCLASPVPSMRHPQPFRSSSTQRDRRPGAGPHSQLAVDLLASGASFPCRLMRRGLDSRQRPRETVVAIRSQESWPGANRSGLEGITPPRHVPLGQPRHHCRARADPAAARPSSRTPHSSRRARCRRRAPSVNTVLTETNPDVPPVRQAPAARQIRAGPVAALRVI